MSNVSGILGSSIIDKDKHDFALEQLRETYGHWVSDIRTATDWLTASVSRQHILDRLMNPCCQWISHGARDALRSVIHALPEHGINLCVAYRTVRKHMESARKQALLEFIEHDHMLLMDSDDDQHATGGYVRLGNAAGVVAMQLRWLHQRTLLSQGNPFTVGMSESAIVSTWRRCLVGNLIMPKGADFCAFMRAVLPALHITVWSIASQLVPSSYIAADIVMDARLYAETPRLPVSADLYNMLAFDRLSNTSVVYRTDGLLSFLCHMEVEGLDELRAATVDSMFVVDE